jgi:hypothetical protein
MKRLTTSGKTALMAAMLAVGFGLVIQPLSVFASGGGGSGGGGGITAKVDTIKVSKCFYDVPTGQMLIKASSSDSSARLFAYLPSGVLLGEVQNGGGSRYGGTVMGYQPQDPIYVAIFSSSGGSCIVPTTPFQI